MFWRSKKYWQSAYCDTMKRAEEAESKLAKAVEERDRLRDDLVLVAEDCNELKRVANEYKAKWKSDEARAPCLFCDRRVAIFCNDCHSDAAFALVEEADKAKESAEERAAKAEALLRETRQYLLDSTGRRAGVLVNDIDDFLAPDAVQGGRNG